MRPERAFKVMSGSLLRPLGVEIGFQRAFGAGAEHREVRHREPRVERDRLRRQAAVRRQAGRGALQLGVEARSGQRGAEREARRRAEQRIRLRRAGAELFGAHAEGDGRLGEGAADLGLRVDRAPMHRLRHQGSEPLGFRQFQADLEGHGFRGQVRLAGGREGGGRRAQLQPLDGDAPVRVEVRAQRERHLLRERGDIRRQQRPQPGGAVEGRAGGAVGRGAHRARHGEGEIGPEAGLEVERRARRRPVQRKVERQRLARLPEQGRHQAVRPFAHGGLRVQPVFRRRKAQIERRVALGVEPPHLERGLQRAIAEMRVGRYRQGRLRADHRSADVQPPHRQTVERDRHRQAGQARQHALRRRPRLRRRRIGGQGRATDLDPLRLDGLDPQDAPEQGRVVQGEARLLDREPHAVGVRHRDPRRAHHRRQRPVQALDRQSGHLRRGERRQARLAALGVRPGEHADEGEHRQADQHEQQQKRPTQPSHGQNAWPMPT